MKKIISLALCIVMLFSVVSVCAVAAERVDANDMMYVQASEVVNGQVTYTVYLKKNVSILGGVILRVGFDKNVLQPISGGAATVVDKYGDESDVVPGLYVNGYVDGYDDLYSIGYINGNLSGSYSTGSSDKAFMKITFKVIDSARPVAKIDFYCVEFTSSDEEMNITKNDEDPQLFMTVNHDTFGNPIINSAKVVKNGIQLSWETIGSADFYRVYKKVDGKWKTLKDIKTGETTYVDTTAQNGAKETYAVKAFKGGMSTSTFNTITAAFASAPASVSAANSGDGVKVSWSAVSKASNYRVFKRVTKADGTKTAWEYLVKSTTAKSYVDTNVANDVKYEYMVRANVGGTYSADSTIVSLYHYDAPTVKLASAKGGVKITWNEIEGAETYKIYRRLNGATSWTGVKTVKAGTLSFVDSGATSGKKVDYAVKAVSSKGSSNYIAKTINYIATPTLTSLTNGTSGAVLKWGAVKGAATYRVYRKAAGATSWTALADVKTTSYTDKTAKSGTKYTYTVKAFNGSLASGYDSTGLTLKYLAMPKLTKISNPTGGITVTWGSVAGTSTGYRVYRKDPGSSSWKLLGTVKTTSYTDKTAVKGKTYAYTVRAVDGSNLSAYNTTGLSIKRAK